MQLYFLRHGRTNYNDLGLCNGDPSKAVYLTETGKAQAREASERLKSVPLERIYTSQLPRTRQTAEIINRYHKVPLESHAAINDILSGCEERPVAEYQQAISQDPLRCKVGDGESLLEYQERVVAFLDWLTNQPYETVAVVAHEETMRIVYGHYHPLDAAQLPKLSFSNCQIIEVEVVDGRATLTLLSTAAA